MSMYKVNLPDMKYARQHSFTLNSNEYRLLFTYSDEMFQILVDFETTNKMRAKSDPLVTVDGVKEYIKDYTYIEYYLSIPEDIDTWLSNQVVLPVSIMRLDPSERKEEIESRILLSRELDSIRTQYKVMCRWQFTLYQNGDIICDGFVEKGSWFMLYGDISISFDYESDYIGYEDIQNVIMYVRVNE